MVITKEELTKAETKYYKFFYQKRPKGKSYWVQIKQDDITKNQDACLEEGIFFAKETDVMQWFKHGDTLAEIVFDKSHALHSKLQNEYFESSSGVCGNTVFATNFISMNSDEMFQFIKAHYDIQQNGIEFLQGHLIFVRAFDTLEKLWEYKYSILGDAERARDMHNAITLLKAYALNADLYRDINAEQIFNCNNWNELLTFVPKEKWILFE